MTLGLATGMGYIGIAVMTGVVMCLLLLVYAAMSFGRRPEEEKELKITIPENLDYTGLFDDLFAQYTRASELVSVRTTGMGSLYTCIIMSRSSRPRSKSSSSTPSAAATAIWTSFAARCRRRRKRSKAVAKLQFRRQAVF